MEVKANISDYDFDVKIMHLKIVHHKYDNENENFTFLVSNCFNYLGDDKIKVDFVTPKMVCPISTLSFVQTDLINAVITQTDLWHKSSKK